MARHSLSIAAAPLVAAAVLASAAYATDSLVPAMGHGIALQLCTSCHLIEAGQVNPPGHVGGPSFQTIADTQDITQAKLKKHLARSNRRVTALTMPNVELTQDERNKLIAYIMSLRKPQGAISPPAKAEGD